MFVYVLVGLFVAVAIVLTAAALRPPEFRVSRSATLPAPPALVFDQVNNLKKWDAWSPWAKLDPAAKMTFDGPEAGTGASMAWDGNNKIGAGRLTIIESTASSLVRYSLAFFRPFSGTSTAELTFVPEGQGTKVTWSMFGKNSFMAKVMSLFMNCEKMIGAQFEQGLRQMGEVARTV